MIASEEGISMFKKFNPNPDGARVGDCVIRAISIATGQDWETTYIGLAIQGLIWHDMPSSNFVWANYLANKGFRKKAIPDTCPECYTIQDFCGEHFSGTYILGTGTHTVAVIDGDYYDTWDSGGEVPIFYWEREEIKDDL